MTRASSPDVPVLIPLGQPLGKIFESDDEAHYQVRLGSEVYRLSMAEAAVWLQLHAARPGTLRGMDRGLLAALDIDRGAIDSSRGLELLLELGLVAEVQLGLPVARDSFAEAYRLLPLQTCIGNSEEASDVFTLAAGDQRTVGVDAVLRQVLVSGPTEASLDSCCDILSGALSVAPETAELGTGQALVEFVLGRVHGPLSAHACYFDRAIELSLATADAARESSATAQVTVDEDDRTEYGTYGVGYLAGARHGRFGLTGIDVRLGREMAELPDVASWLTWSYAHGFYEDGRLQDDPAQIIEAAGRAGVDAAAGHLRHLSNTGLVQQPDGAEVIEMAATHRFEPLLAGIGATPDEPGTFYLGVNADQVVTALTDAEYEVWRSAHLSESLLLAAKDAGRADSVADLVDYLRDVQALTVKRAGYLDLVRTP
ncbi:hypothetical protein [Blastococcus sp. Marseille-P5729]|uniref:hypothetical protein n=1 Tax=Blastococcus sp. Marseille-P5729 TaxID=2086582 RepID=UPI000D0FB0ED|nr:hypothetical protein [Blastococcus sp. Marseille-P5729]